MAQQYLGDGNTTGTSVVSTGEKLSFYGGTPVVIRSGSSQSALTLTTATTTGFGFSTSAGFDAMTAQLEEIRAVLVATGLMTGS